MLWTLGSKRAAAKGLSYFGHPSGRPRLVQALTKEGEPDPEAYFAALDNALVAAASRQFAIDLLWADRPFLQKHPFAAFEERDPLLRYLIARYGGLNVTWNGIEQYEDVPDSRSLLKSIGDVDP